MRQSRQEAVPQGMQERFEAVMGIVDPFCRTHLNEEYAALCRRMAAALSRKRPSPLAGGTARVWACAIVYAAGKVNFLSDKSQKPHLSSAELCRLMEVSLASASAKSGQILDILGAMPLDPRWCLPSRLADNPLAWMITVNGIVMDARSAPRKIQEEASRLGLIPYLPGADTEEVQAPDKPTP
ncbi:MAG: hypothetical protein HY922_08075 [Elusimicrobia bacterium]|nr:hypothetical protein [Elusimicrobiota bacterium]